MEFRSAAGGWLVAWLVAVTAGLCALGVGGYRGGFLIVLVVLLAGVAVWAWRLSQGIAGRGWWLAGAVVLAVVGAAASVDLSPPSRGVLLHDVSGVAPPFEHRIGRQVSGHSWCLPRCPVLIEQWDAPGTDPRGQLVDWIGAFEAKHVLRATRSPFGVLAPGTERVRARAQRLVVDVVVAPGQASGRNLVTVTLRGKR